MSENTPRRQEIRRRGPMSMVGGEKAKNFKQTFFRLAKLLRPQLSVIGVMVLFAVLSTVLGIVIPLATSRVLKLGESFTKSGIWQTTKIVRLLIIIAALYLGSALTAFISQFISSKMSQTVVYNMRKDLDAKLNRLPVSFFDGQSKGDILSRITNDIEAIALTLQQSITQIITSIISIIGIIIMMLLENPAMTAVSLASLPLILAVTAFIAKRAQKQFKLQQKYLGKINGQIEEKFAGHKVEKLFGHEQQSLKIFSQDNRVLVDASQKAQFMSGIIMPVLNFINNFMYVVMVVLGAYFVTKTPVLSVSLIYLFTTYSRQLSQPINQTASIANIIQGTVAAAERVFEIMDEKEMPSDINSPADISKVIGAVEFKGVDFSYSPDKQLIKDMNISVKAGGIVAIVGPTGAGKTTLVNLLMRFYEIGGGKICLDGVDLRNFTREGLRSVYSMVLQDTWLFAGTVRENIAYGKQGATDGEVQSAAEKAHIDHFINTLPNGYDTVLAEDASNLSQGQRQLLTIARAICSDYKILILDEATSSVDTRTESYIQNAMTKMMSGKTSFVIAHRLSTIKKADVILVMNEGQVIEQGRHRELIDKGGFYAELYNSQFLHREGA